MPSVSPRPSAALMVREELIVEALFSGARALKHHLRPALEREGLTLPMFWAINQLVAEGPMSLGAIASACAVTPANVSTAAEDLETSGLVVRRPSESDRRVVRLALTPRGRSVHRAVFGHLASLVSGSLSGVPSRDLEATARVLGRLAPAPASSPGRILESPA